MNQITQELNRRNIPTRKGKKWTVNTIRGILHNPVYIGKIRWNARKEVKRIEILSPRKAAKPIFLFIKNII